MYLINNKFFIINKLMVTTIKRWKQSKYIINNNNKIIINNNNNNNNYCTNINNEHQVIIDNNYNFDEIPYKQIRNFSIIAHVDHGKSTLADRLLEYTGTIKKTNDNKQVLDSLQVERERGITVKAQTVSLLYRYEEKIYLLNLIDTPGHVDFSNEVTRSLAACDGVILLIDANHGIQAQTVSNYYLAKKRNLKIITVLNKIDLKHSNPERVCCDIKTLFNIDPVDVLKISAKLGTGIDEVLKNIILKIPPPTITTDRKENQVFSALLFDSWYDRYRGALNLICVKNGELRLGDEITLMSNKKSYEVKSLSIMRTTEYPVKCLKIGQVGLIGCNMRNSKEAVIGDTMHLKGKPCEQLLGIKSLQPMVFAGVYPCEQIQHVQLRNAIEKLCLNDSAVTFVPDSSPALGQGWRLGFLGLLHMEVFCQRLEQEYGTEPIMTAPSVTYKIKLRKSKKTIKHNQDNIVYISNPALLPADEQVEEYFEPFILGTIITPVEYVGKIISLCVEKRGVEMDSINIDDTRIMMKYLLPLADVILDFYDYLKACSSGYASFDYEEYGYHPTNIVKMSILLNGQPIDELSTIVHTTKATAVGREMVKRLKDLIPRQMVQIAVQSCIGSKVIARETIKAYRKDVTAKLYGGDVTRRMKLLRQQAEGKKKMRSIANINIPRNTFINVLKR